MRNQWKNNMKVLGYIASIMLLLIGSLPLTGVFAEVNQDNEMVEEIQEAVSEEGVENASTEAEEEYSDIFQSEQDGIDESYLLLDTYLLSGCEAISVTKTDGYVINKGNSFGREYFITLENYNECENNILGNYLLQATYEIYQGDTVLQNGTIQIGNGIDDNFYIEYSQTGEYIIEIKTSAYEEIDGEYVWVSDKVLHVFTEKIEKSHIQLQENIEKEGHFSYREDFGRSVSLSFFVEGFQAEQNGDISYAVSSGNEAVITVKNPQESYSLKDIVWLEITGVGQADLVIQPMEQKFYEIEAFVIPIVVENSPIKEDDYRISYLEKNNAEPIIFQDFSKWQDFLEQRRNWLNGTVSIQLTETGEQYYSGIGYIEGATTIMEEKHLALSMEAEIQQVDIWLSNMQNNSITKNHEDGIRSFRVGIDQTPPINTELIYSQNAYEPTSTETTRFYGENFRVCGSFQDMLSGIKYIEYTTQADLGMDAEWQQIKDVEIEDNNASFEFILEKGIFTGIALRATDIAGNQSAPIEIKNDKGEYLTIIVDKTEPMLSIMLKTLDGEQYDGEWTNQPITIYVQEDRENKTLSGIQEIEYQYVRVGEKYQENTWEKLDEAGELQIGFDEKIKKNGTYYFRAITNSGIITTLETQKRNGTRIQLQQTCAEKKDIIETLPQLEQNQVWYNKKSGVPFVQIEYPEYDTGVTSMEYDAPIIIHTRLTAVLSEEEELTPIYKTATIGIHSEEEYRRLCAGETVCIEDELRLLSVDFSYDKQTGYALDGIYELEYWITDEAGNESKHDSFTYKIDTHEPEALEILVDGTPMQEDDSQTIVFERFYQTSVNGSASADFGISGKGTMKFMVAESIGDWNSNTNWFQAEDFVISPCTSGCIYMIAEDGAGNQAVLRTRGIVVDNLAPIGEDGGKFITIRSTANENHFYNDYIEIGLSATDLPQNTGFSALESFSCVIGTVDGQKEQEKELFSFYKSLPSKEEIESAKSYSTTEILDATTFEGNDTYVEIIARDRCGNVMTSREELKIDITAPIVDITFDINEARNGRYYNTVRTASIHVQELNFDKNGIVLQITRNGEPYVIPCNEWQSDGINHWSTVTFLEDGDYTITASCKDLADNVSEEVSAEPFTIDLTKPVIEISYEDNKGTNELYFQSERIAYITVKEHNFNENDFILMAEPMMPVSEWSHHGDEHVIQLSFTQNHYYQFSCAYTDMAGNEAASIEEQSFYIDSIAPQIVIQGVKDESANAGEIMPIVTVYDTNHNKDGVEIVVTTGMGEGVPISVQVQEAEQGYSYILTDLSEKEDNVYFLQVTAFDMAGNKSELIYRFSLNRYGSTYDLTEISNIRQRVYNQSNQLSDISIIEMNVDEIEEYSIYITRNGKMLSCRETKERPQSDDLENEEICYYVEKTGDEKEGYRNRYVFYEENFTKEGTYRITCYSKDRAGNETNNTIEEKQAEISFVIDNTAPKVVIEGIEAGGIYNEEAQVVHIMVQDNFMLKEARFTLINESGEEIESWDYLELAKEQGDVISITIPSLEERQTLLYQVSDMAGNELVLLPDSEDTPTSFLITTNVWLRFISSPAKIIGGIFACITILVVCWFYINRKSIKNSNL